MAKMQWYDWVSIGLLTVGGLNWGLVGAFNFNLVEFIFKINFLVRIVYILVGISAIYSFVFMIKQLLR